jgi:hypothetical protein
VWKHLVDRFGNRGGEVWAEPKSSLLLVQFE